MSRVYNRRRLYAVAGAFGLVCLVLLAILVVYRVQRNVASLNESDQLLSMSEPGLRYTDFLTGLDHPTSIVFPNQELMLYGLQNGEIHAFIPSTKETWLLLRPTEITTGGDRGLQSMALDIDFIDNHYLYACYSAKNQERGSEMRVSRWQISNDYKAVEGQLDIVTGIPNPTDQHLGCALAMGRLGYVWVGTGDGGIASAPQDPKSLAGKILRVERNGNPAEGNLSAPFDPRIFSYGHRDVKGMTRLDSPLLNGAYGYSIERGNTSDDEINYLTPSNFGWDPLTNGTYNDNAPMTNLSKYPDAVKALWSSGRPTLQVSSLVQLSRKRWQAWQNRLVVTTMDPASSRLIELSSDGAYKSEKPFLTDYGAIRTAVLGPEGNLYIATSGSDGRGKIVEVEVICTVCD